MKRILVTAFLCLMALAASCSESRRLPDFVNPAKTHGFTQLAHGEDAGEKEPGSFWIFAGDVPFSTWRNATAATLTANQWTVGRQQNITDSEIELLAGSPDGQSCLAFYNLDTGDPRTAYDRRRASLLAPEALKAASPFQTSMLVVALQCP